MVSALRILGIVCAAGIGLAPLAAVDADAAHARVDELMAALPAPPDAEVRLSRPPEGDTPMAKGVLISPERRVVLTGTVLFDEGPASGLEVLACLQQGKTHESLVGLDTGDAQVVKAAFIAALGLVQDGVPAEEASAVPARGTPVGVEIHWQPDPLLEPDRWVSAPASSLVRSRQTDHAYPPLPYVWTGSHFQVIDQEIPGSGLERRERFMLEVTRTVVANFDNADSLLASPFPGAAEDVRFEVNTALVLPKGAPVSMVFTRVELPLTLAAGAGEELRHDGTLIDDAALQALLAERYAPEAEVEGETLWRAVAVVAPPPDGAGAGIDDATVVALRERIIAAAAEAGVWAVPIFTIE